MLISDSKAVKAPGKFKGKTPLITATRNVLFGKHQPLSANTTAKTDDGIGSGTSCKTENCLACLLILKVSQVNKI